MVSRTLSLLDLKLGLRMLRRHPGLSLVATIAVAFAIAVGTVGFEIARQVLWPAIPLPDGNAIVALRNWDVADSRPVAPSTRDYALWRDGLATLTDLGAVVAEERSVAVGAGPGYPETVASVTASTFALTRVPAAIGRSLLEADERPGAEPVVVVGHAFWTERLGGTADAIGRVIRISGAPATVVGVMPPGYGFPLRNQVWRPLKLDGLPASSGLDHVFGRLAPGKSREDAATEAAALGTRSAKLFPDTHANLRLQLLSLPDAVSDLPAAGALVLASVNLFLLLLTALLCGDVAMLLFARAVSRERELLVRAALGASRGRFVLQLFTEALLLCALGAALGLLVAGLVLERAWLAIEAGTGPLPFWIDTAVSPTTVLYALALTLFAAAIAGVVPALKVTARGAAARLRAASSGGGGLRFGGVWTVVIVCQVALTTLLPVPLLGVGADVTRETPAGFAAGSFLTATLDLDRMDGVAAAGDSAAATPSLQLAARYRALEDRLRNEPGVLGVTYADTMPLQRHAWRAIVLDPGPAAAHSERCVGGYCVGTAAVDPRFFEVLGAPVASGRPLTTADAEQHTRAVLVNRFFVEQVLGGGNPLGRRFRFASAQEPGADAWHEIVGVVPDLGVSDNTGDLGRARVYQAVLPQQAAPLSLAIQVRGDPQAFAVRLRELAQDVDPALRVIDPVPMPRLAESLSAFWIGLLLALTAVTVMLSLAGVHAVMAFAVARRTREIGVRVALGARPLRVLAAVFRRPLIQIALGIGIGAILALAMANNDLSDLHLDDFGMTALFALAALLCCALACIVPTRRALRVQPAEALRDPD